MSAPESLDLPPRIVPEMQANIVGLAPHETIMDQFEIVAPLAVRKNDGPISLLRPEIYKAIDSEEEPVVVKIFHEKGGEKSEKLAVADMAAHGILGGKPNIAQPRAIGVMEKDGAEYHVLVTDYAEGGSLETQISRGTRRLFDVLRMLRDVSIGLKDTHEYGLIHRDIKPGNILDYRNLSRWCITDFELAMAVSDPNIELAQEALGKLAVIRSQSENPVLGGTEGFIAPERYKGEEGPEVDVFSLGVTVFEAATGRMPFSLRDYRYAVTNEAPATLRSFNRSIPHALHEYVDACLRAGPSNRPTDEESRLLAEELIAADPENIELPSIGVANEPVQAPLRPISSILVPRAILTPDEVTTDLYTESPLNPGRKLIGLAA